MNCSVINCPSISGKDILFFDFPNSGTDEYRKWISFCGRGDDWKIKKDCQVCELHFKDSDKTGDLLKQILKVGAVPECSILCPFIENSCRVCLTEIPDELVSLYYTLVDGIAIKNILEYCTSVEIQSSDLFPKSICIECLKKLTEARKFKELTLKTDHKLRSNLFFVQQIKAEKESIAPIQEEM